MFKQLKLKIELLTYERQTKSYHTSAIKFLYHFSVTKFGFMFSHMAIILSFARLLNGECQLNSSYKTNGQVYSKFIVSAALCRVSQPGLDRGQQKVVCIVTAVPSQWSRKLHIYLHKHIHTVRVQLFTVHFRVQQWVHYEIQPWTTSVYLQQLCEMRTQTKYPTQNSSHFGERTVVSWVDMFSGDVQPAR